MNEWFDQTRNDQVWEQAVWFTQDMLLAPTSNLERMAEAVRKIQSHARHFV